MKPRKHKYSNQCYADGGEVKSGRAGSKKKKKATRREGDTNRSTGVGSTVDTLRNRRAQQMADLGLKDGGRVKKVKAGRKRGT